MWTSCVQRCSCHIQGLWQPSMGQIPLLQFETLPGGGGGINRNVSQISVIPTMKLTSWLFFLSGTFHRCLGGFGFWGQGWHRCENKQTRALLPLPRVKHCARFREAVPSPSVSPRASCWISCLCLRRAPHPASLPSAAGFSAHPGELFLKRAHYLSS